MASLLNRLKPFRLKAELSQPELARLADQLRSAPESREDLIKDVARRFANGEYASRETAERTAAIIAENPFGEFIRGN